MSGSFTSRESYAAPVTQPGARGPDPRATTQVSSALATGLADVASNFAGLWARAEYAQQVNDATAIVAKQSMDLADMQRGFDADPDPATVPARFKERAAEFRAKAIEGLDPGVARHVGRQLDQMLPTAYRQVSGAAYQRHIGNLRGTMATTLGTHAQAMASAADEPQLLEQVQAAKQAIAGNAKAGVIQEADARPLFSNALRQAITIRAATDPVAAQALLTRFRDEMEAADVAALTTGLRAPLERRQGEDAATRAIAMTGDTAARAALVIDGLVARGLPRHVAVGLAANAVQESGANPSPGLGDGGMSSGLFQWNRDRRAAFKAQYGRDPHEASLDQQLDFAVAELGGTERSAGTALLATTTAEDAARVASTRFLRPRDTAVEETRRAGIATRLGGGTASQRDAAIAMVREDLKDAPLHVRLSAESQTAAHYSHLEAQNQQARALLGTDLRDLAASYEAGNTGAEIPEARIRTLAPTPEAAQRTIDELTLARSTGDAVRAVAYASPGEEAETRARLAGDATETRMAGQRQAAVASFDAAIDRKRRAAFADPVNYAASAPEVAALRAAGAPLPQQIAASLAVQSRIGLPPSRQRILDNGQVETMAATLRSTGPEKADMAITLANLGAQYGPELWNRAYGELVQHGKIGWEWQAVAAMTAPAQAEGRALLQRALVFEAEKGGREALRKLVAPDVMKGFDAEIATAMAEFAEATRHHPGGDRLFDTTRRAVETLATYHAWRGAKASDAASRAYQDVIGARFDLAGDDGSATFGRTPTMLVPKGRASEIEMALERTRLALTPRELQALPDPSRPGAAAAELAEATMQAARRGVWINNADGSGAVLKGRTPGGSVVNILRSDGSPIEISFERLPVMTPAAQRDADLEEGRAAARALRERSR
jgi:hypothetical protein